MKKLLGRVGDVLFMGVFFIAIAICGGNWGPTDE